MFEALSWIVAPAQYGPVLVAVGALGIGLTVTGVVPAVEVQPLTVAVTEYVPAIAVVEFTMVGFCRLEVKPFGPVHEYVAPLIVEALSWIVAPAQYGPVLEAVGALGIVLTVTGVVPAVEVQPLTVAVTEYVPDIAAVEFAIVGFCRLDVKPFGPVHEYVAPLIVEALSWIVVPSQYGPVLVAVGALGIGLTVTGVVPAVEVQPLTVAVTEYVPAIAVVEFAIVGFCRLEVKPFGPVHEYVAPLIVDALSWIVAPAQYGPVLEAVGALGIVLTVTVVVPAVEVQTLTVAVTEYVPDIAVVEFAMVGFCRLEVKPFGPVHEYVAPLTVDALS